MAQGEEEQFEWCSSGKFYPYLTGRLLFDHSHLLHFDVLELCGFLGFALQLLLSFRKRRFSVLLGVLLCGLVVESIVFWARMYAHNNSHVHALCFLPLKDLLWYGNTIFNSVAILEDHFAFSPLGMALVSGVLSTLQAMPFHMTQALNQVEAVFLNEQVTFQWGNNKEKIGDASVQVIICFLALSIAMSFVVLICTRRFHWILNPVLIPVLSIVFLFLILLALFLVKVPGCLNMNEKHVLALSRRCIAYSNVPNISVLTVFGVICFLALVFVFMTRKPVQISPQQSTSFRTDFMLSLGTAATSYVFPFWVLVTRAIFVTKNEQIQKWVTLSCIVVTHIGLLLMAMFGNKVVAERAEKKAD